MLEQEIPSSEMGWQQLIETHIDAFGGNTKHAAVLLDAFTGGIRYVYRRLIRRGLQNFWFPTVIITLQDQADLPHIGCIEDGKSIYIKKTLLESFSLPDPASLRTGRNNLGEVIFQGTPMQWFLLTGVEEGHHAAFLQIKGGAKDHKTRMTLSSAEYYADEAEYRALKWKIRFAEERQFPDEVIRLLKEQRVNATQFRLKQSQ